MELSFDVTPAPCLNLIQPGLQNSLFNPGGGKFTPHKQSTTYKIPYKKDVDNTTFGQSSFLDPLCTYLLVLKKVILYFNKFQAVQLLV